MIRAIMIALRVTPDASFSNFRLSNFKQTAF
jgi:hypothetical protein